MIINTEDNFASMQQFLTPRIPSKQSRLIKTLAPKAAAIFFGAAEFARDKSVFARRKVAIKASRILRRN